MSQAEAIYETPNGVLLYLNEEGNPYLQVLYPDHTEGGTMDLADRWMKNRLEIGRGTVLLSGVSVVYNDLEVEFSLPETVTANDWPTIRLNDNIYPLVQRDVDNFDVITSVDPDFTRLIEVREPEVEDVLSVHNNSPDGNNSPILMQNLGLKLWPFGARFVSRSFVPTIWRSGEFVQAGLPERMPLQQSDNNYSLLLTNPTLSNQVRTVLKLEDIVTG